MADYQKMYAVLCIAIDREIDALQKIPLAKPSAERLTAALQEAEELYINTSVYAQPTDIKKIYRIKRD